MILLQTTRDGFELLFNGRKLLVHSAAHPLLEYGTGRAVWWGKHAAFKTRDSAVGMKKAGAFILLPVQDGVQQLEFPGFGRMTFCERDGRLHLGFCTEDAGLNRLRLRLCASVAERVYGCGEQYSFFNLRGRKVPLISAEQGLGRGINPVRLAADLVAGAGGTRFSTYFALPVFVTSSLLSCCCRTTAWCAFDFRHRHYHELNFRELPTEIVLDTADSMPELVGRLSDFTGRQPRLPDWAFEGLILGAQGGTVEALRKLKAVQAAGADVQGLWIQDWEGRRQTGFGSQLFWNWQADESLYPGLKQTIDSLRASGVRVLGYINHFLALDGPLYAEAARQGYLVKKDDKSDYIIQTAGFPAALVDLTNPAAWAWLKQVIKDNMIALGLAGWMADFGEYLPMDAVLASGESPETAHNIYPVLWAKLNREAVEESGQAADLLFFSRSGHLDSQRYAQSFWAGDQMVDWSRDDGLASVIPAALSLGLCGIGHFHSDIGGYTSLAWAKRSPELLLRWTELSAFTPIMRSHESNRPALNAQFWDSPELLTQAARYSRIHTALAAYSRSLADEYQERGLPLMRPLFLHYPQEEECWKQGYTWLYGPDLLVAPVLKPGRKQHRVYLPEDDWVHLWTGRVYRGGWQSVPAPLGSIPVFYRMASEWKDLFAALAEL